MGRQETGMMQVGDDWPGLFIRGDDCITLLEILVPIQSYGKALTPELVERLINIIEDDILGHEERWHENEN